MVETASSAPPRVDTARMNFVDDDMALVVVIADLINARGTDADEPVVRGIV